jgi:hypothetical protein
MPGYYVRQDALEAARKEYQDPNDPAHRKVVHSALYLSNFLIRFQKLEALKIRKREWMTVRSLGYSTLETPLTVTFAALSRIGQLEESTPRTILPEQG